MATVHPQNNLAAITEEGEHRENSHRHRNMNFTQTKKCIGLCILIIIVILVICAIAIPLVVILTRKKDTAQLTTIPTTESTTSVEATTTTPSTTIKRTETTSSSTFSGNTVMHTTIEIMASTISSIFDIQSMASVISTSTEIDHSDTIEITSVDTSTATNSISSKWENDRISTMISSADTTSEKPTIASTESESTTPRPRIALNRVNDTIIGLSNAKASGSSSSYNSSREMPKDAMDGNLTTKYYNSQGKTGLNNNVEGPGIGTGFIVIPSISNSTVACGLQFATGNDRPNRDPITVTLEGSNTTTLEALHIGSSWTLIYNGSTGINATSSPNRTTYGEVQNFSNTIRFASYRLLVTSKRNGSDAVQYSEAIIMGYF